MSVVRLRHRGQTREIRLQGDAAWIDGRLVPFESLRTAEFERLAVGDRIHPIVAARDGDRVFVWCAGEVFAFDVVRSVRASAGSEHEGDLLSPMPGRVRRILTAVGSRVARGDLLLVLEAMKMEHAMRAPRDGVVKRLGVKEGDLVEAGAELVEIG